MHAHARIHARTHTHATDLAHHKSQSAMLEAKALESCELSEMWADKARKVRVCACVQMLVCHA
jgi:hypothetical protein